MKTSNCFSQWASWPNETVSVRGLLTALAILFTVLTLSPLSYSQIQQANLDSTIAVVRADTQADRVSIITATMNFNEKEGTLFWPIYRKYEYERSMLDDKRVGVIKDYAAKFQSLTDADAKAMAQQMMDCDSQLAELKKKYYKKLNNVLPALTVTKFFQLEHRIDLVMDTKVESALPPIGQPMPSGEPQQPQQER